jgi:hypothetical protein
LSAFIEVRIILGGKDNDKFYLVFGTGRRQAVRKKGIAMNLNSPGSFNRHRGTVASCDPDFSGFAFQM